MVRSPLKVSASISAGKGFGICIAMAVLGSESMVKWQTRCLRHGTSQQNYTASVTR